MLAVKFLLSSASSAQGQSFKVPGKISHKHKNVFKQRYDYVERCFYLQSCMMRELHLTGIQRTQVRILAGSQCLFSPASQMLHFDMQQSKYFTWAPSVLLCCVFAVELRDWYTSSTLMKERQPHRCHTLLQPCILNYDIYPHVGLPQLHFVPRNLSCHLFLVMSSVHIPKLTQDRLHHV